MEISIAHRTATMQMLQLVALFAFFASAAAQATDFRDFVMQEEYDRVTLAAGLAVAGFAAVMMVVILLRDILGIWTCFGVTESKRSTVPVRTLTAMSAAYLANQETGLTQQA